MNELVKVEVVNGKPCVTSLQVAEAFGKEQKNVLADIRNTISKCSESFSGLNFQLAEYKKKKKKQSLSSIEDLTSELERLQGENEALKQQVAAGQALNGLDPFTKSVIIDKVAAIVNGTSAAEIKEFLDYIDIFDKYRKFTKGE